MKTAEPRDVGIDASRLELVFQTIERQVAAGQYYGGSFLVARRGRVVAARGIGKSDPSTQRAARADDVYCLFSTTKPLTATLLLHQVDAGRVRLTDRVADHIPEFGAAGKAGVTVAQVLTHTAGFANLAPDWPPPSWADWDGTIARICAQAIEHEPGKAVVYHALTGSWILAEIARRVDGGKRSFARMMAEDVFGPLGMKDAGIGIRPELENRRVPIKATAPGGVPFPLEFLEMFNELRHAEIPGGGAFATTSDVARFYQMWLNGGELEGTRLLSPALVDLATKNHTGDEGDRFLDLVRLQHGWGPIPAVRGLGFWLRGEGIFHTFFGTLASPRTFGHPGASSIMAWADPARDLIFVALTAGLIEEGAHLLRIQQLSDLVHASVVD